MVRATPMVPPSWRTAWLTAPPTPRRFGGSAWAVALAICGKQSATPTPVSSMRRQVVGDVLRRPRWPAAPQLRRRRRRCRRPAAAGADRSVPASRPKRGASTATSSGPGLMPRPALRVDQPHTFGQEQVRAEEHRREGEPEHERRGVRPAEVADGEAGRGRAPGARPALVGDEHTEQQGEPTARAERPGVTPAPRVALHDTERSEGRGGRDEDNAPERAGTRVSGSLDSVSTRRPSDDVTSPTGTLIRNTQRQLAASTSEAPTVGPMAPASAPMAPQMATATGTRSAGNGPQHERERRGDERGGAGGLHHSEADQHRDGRRRRTPAEPA